MAIGDTITVADLAQKLALKGGEVVKALFKMGVMATITQSIDHDTAALVTEELGHKAIRANDNDAEDALLASAGENQGEATSVRRWSPSWATSTTARPRCWITSAAPRLPPAKPAASPAHRCLPRGYAQGRDQLPGYPGHAAFTSMRARRRLTDIVVLVVAADDGVMPQTKEAIQHARSAGVPLIVAINKIDSPTPTRCGSRTNCCPSRSWPRTSVVTPRWWRSRPTGLGIDDLLDAISIQAELLELKAVDEGRASGVVIESSLDKGRGPVATVLVQQGRLKKGDYLVCGIQYGRVRALFDETGKQPAFAGRPSRCRSWACPACRKPVTTSWSSRTSAWPGRCPAA